MPQIRERLLLRGIRPEKKRQVSPRLRRTATQNEIAQKRSQPRSTHRAHHAVIPSQPKIAQQPDLHSRKHEFNGLTQAVTTRVPDLRRITGFNYWVFGSMARVLQGR